MAFLVLGFPNNWLAFFYHPIKHSFSHSCHGWAYSLVQPPIEVQHGATTRQPPTTKLSPHPGNGWEGRYVPGMQWRKEAVDLLVVCSFIIGSILSIVGETHWHRHHSCQIFRDIQYTQAQGGYWPANRFLYGTPVSHTHTYTPIHQEYALHKSKYFQHFTKMNQQLANNVAKMLLDHLEHWQFLVTALFLSLCVPSWPSHRARNSW